MDTPKLVKRSNIAPFFVFIDSLSLDRQVVRLLLNNDTDVNRSSEDGFTPLHIAAKVGFLEIVTMLLNAKADVTTVDKKGFTSLLFAATGNSDRHASIGELLLRSGADCEHLAKDHRTPLICAISKDCPLFVELLLSHGALVNQKVEKRSPLAHAALKGRFDIVKMLLDRGAIVDKPDDGSIATPLFLAATSYHRLVTTTNLSYVMGSEGAYSRDPVRNAQVYQMVVLLLTAKADVNKKCCKEGSVLDWTPSPYDMESARSGVEARMCSLAVKIRRQDSEENYPRLNAQFWYYGPHFPFQVHSFGFPEIGDRDGNGTRVRIKQSLERGVIVDARWSGAAMDKWTFRVKLETKKLFPSSGRLWAEDVWTEQHYRYQYTTCLQGYTQQSIDEILLFQSKGYVLQD